MENDITPVIEVLTQPTLMAERRRRIEFWNNLRTLRQEFLKEKKIDINTFDVLSFDIWLQENYGIKMILIEGNISTGYEIVDEHKHLIFLLKY